MSSVKVFKGHFMKGRMRRAMLTKARRTACSEYSSFIRGIREDFVEVAFELGFEGWLGF